LVDDDDTLRRSIARELIDADFLVTQATNGKQAIEMIARQSFDGVLTDLQMPEADGIAVIRAARSAKPPIPAVMLTAQGSVVDCVAAMREGARNFLTKPAHPTHLIAVLRDALADDRPGTIRETAAAVVGHSSAIRHLLRAIESLAGHDNPVFVVSEKGAGGEIVARLIHGASKRAPGPFVIVQGECSDNDFESAKDGTLFVVWPASPSTQTIETTFRALEYAGDVRLVIGSPTDVGAVDLSADQAAILTQGKLVVPSLRDRAEDIPLLAHYFLEQANSQFAKRTTLPPAVLEAMRAYAWPGNVSELRAMVERIVVGDKETDVIEAVHTRVWLADGLEIDCDPVISIADSIAQGHAFVDAIRGGKRVRLATTRIAAWLDPRRETARVTGVRATVRLSGGHCLAGWLDSDDASAWHENGRLLLSNGRHEITIIAAHVALVEWA
jgi:DNA-binding NtrC family response regulator